MTNTLQWNEFSYTNESDRFENWCFVGDIEYNTFRLKVAASDREITEEKHVKLLLDSCARWAIDNIDTIFNFVEISLNDQGLNHCMKNPSLDCIVLHQDYRSGDYFTVWHGSTGHTPIAFISASDFSFIGEASLYE